MLSRVFKDLLKPRWRKIIETLKEHGGMPVSDIARRSGGHYMTVKTHCDELAKAGYLTRTRLPRTEVGRPEIFFSLSAKADALFPQAGVEFTLELLEEVRQMHGESAPDKLLYQYFSKVAARHAQQLASLDTLAEKARKLAELRCRSGHACRFEMAADNTPAQLIESHNPLSRVIERHPHAATFEQRMIEQLLGTRVTRREIPSGRETSPRVIFEMA
jgi:predicted ArsR family transcriptional regulator